MATEASPDVPRSPETPVVESPSSPPMISGKGAMCIVAFIGVVGAASAWLYRFDQTRVPREFWGFESPRIFAEAQKVTAVLIKPEVPGAAGRPEYYDDLFMIDGLRYAEVKRQDVTARDDMKNVRDRLRDHRSYNTGTKQWKQPEWRFCLIFENDHQASGAKYTGSIIFDSECALGRPQSIDKVISTAPMSAELRVFFESVFPEAKSMEKTSQTPTHSFTQPLAAPSPAGSPAGAGPLAAPQNSDVLTLPTQNPSSVASPVPGAAATASGPSVLGKGPIVVPNVPLPPALGGATQLPQGLQLPGAAPAGAGGGIPGMTPPNPLHNIQIPAGALPTSTPNRNPTNPFDFNVPRGVTVPQLEGAGS